MAEINNLYSAAEEIQTPFGISNTKADSLKLKTAAKRAALSGNTGYAIVGNTRTGNDPDVNYLLNTKDEDILNIYGSTLGQELLANKRQIEDNLSKASNANLVYNRDRNSLTDLAKDTTLATGQGITNATIGAAGFLGGLVNSDLGKNINSVSEGINENLNDLKTPLSRAKSDYSSQISNIQQQENLEDYQNEVDQGSSPLIAGTKRIAKDALSATKRAFSSPEALADVTGQGIGSIIPAAATAALTGGSSLVAGASARATQAFNLANKYKTAAQAAATAGDSALAAAYSARATQAAQLGQKALNSIQRAKEAGAIGAYTLQGAGEGYQNAQQDINELSDEYLQQNSPQYNELIDQGNTPEQARTILANKAGLISGLFTAPINLAGGTFTKNILTNPLRKSTTTSVERGLQNILNEVPKREGIKKVLSDFGKDTIKEYIEEGLQGGSSQLASNIVQQQVYDPNKDILNQVGQSLGEESVGGLGAAGLLGSPRTATRALKTSLTSDKNYSKQLDKIINKQNSSNKAIEPRTEDSNTTKVESTKKANKATVEPSIPNIYNIPDNIQQKIKDTYDTEIKDIPTALQSIGRFIEETRVNPNQKDIVDISYDILDDLSDYVKNINNQVNIESNENNKVKDLTRKALDTKPFQTLLKAEPLKESINLQGENDSIDRVVPKINKLVTKDPEVIKDIQDNNLLDYLSNKETNPDKYQVYEAHKNARNLLPTDQKIDKVTQETLYEGNQRNPKRFKAGETRYKDILDIKNPGNNKNEAKAKLNYLKNFVDSKINRHKAFDKSTDGQKVEYLSHTTNKDPSKAWTTKEVFYNPKSKNSIDTYNSSLKETNELINMYNTAGKYLETYGIPFKELSPLVNTKVPTEANRSSQKPSKDNVIESTKKVENSSVQPSMKETKPISKGKDYFGLDKNIPNDRKIIAKYKSSSIETLPERANKVNKLANRDKYKSTSKVDKADAGYVIYDGYSKGAESFIKNLLDNDKPVRVYVNPLDKFYLLNKQEDYNKLRDNMKDFYHNTTKVNNNLKKQLSEEINKLDNKNITKKDLSNVSKNIRDIKNKSKDNSLNELLDHARNKWQKINNSLKENKSKEVSKPEKISITEDKNMSEYSDKVRNILNKKLNKNTNDPFSSTNIIYSKYNLLGNSDLLDQKAIAIVGTQFPSKETVSQIQNLVKDYVKKGYVIVSGNARGVDTIAHKTALENGGKSIFVIPNSFKGEYTKKQGSIMNTPLFNSDNSLVITPWDTSSTNNKDNTNFGRRANQRNRWIFALADKTYSFEGKTRDTKGSGTTNGLIMSTYYDLPVSLINYPGNKIAIENFGKEKNVSIEKPINIDDKVILPKRNQYSSKDQVKSDKANKFIGNGSEVSSTEAYRKAWKDKANTGEYTSKDIVFLSAEGNRKGRVLPNYKEIQKAIDAKATIITDTINDRQRSYNIGEREVAGYLSSHNYKEVSPGEWKYSKPQNINNETIIQNEVESTNNLQQEESVKLDKDGDKVDVNTIAEEVTDNNKDTIIPLEDNTTTYKNKIAFKDSSNLFQGTIASPVADKYSDHFFIDTQRTNLYQNKYIEDSLEWNKLDIPVKGLISKFLLDKFNIDKYFNNILDKAKLEKLNYYQNAALPFINKDNNQFHPKVKEALALAASMIVLDPKFIQRKSVEDISKITGENPSQETIDLVNNSQNLSQLLLSTERNLKNILGYVENKYSPIELSQYPIQALAANLVSSMVENNILKKDTIYVDEDKELTLFNLNKTLFNEQELSSNQGDILRLTSPLALEYSFSPIKETKDTVKRTPTRISKREKKSLEKAQSTPYYLDNKLYQTLLNHPKKFMKFLGLEAIPAELNNMEYAEYLKGINIGIRSTLNKIRELTIAIENNSPDKKIDEVPIYWKAFRGREGRLHLEGISPQSSPILREFFTSVGTEINLDNQEHRDNFTKSIAQALGIKIEKYNIAEIQNQLNEILESDDIKEVRELIKNNNIPDKPVVSLLGYKALRELNDITEAINNNKKTYKTNMYIEIDGKADGIYNSLVHYLTDIKQDTINKFNSMGRYFPDLDNFKSYEEYSKSSYALDMYEYTADAGKITLKELRQYLSDNPRMTNSIKLLINSGIFKDNGTGDIIIPREYIKTPVTQYSYAAGISTLGNTIIDSLNDIVSKEVYQAKKENKNLKDLPLFDNLNNNAINYLINPNGSINKKAFYSLMNKDSGLLRFSLARAMEKALPYRNIVENLIEASNQITANSHEVLNISLEELANEKGGIKNLTPNEIDKLARETLSKYGGEYRPGVITTSLDSIIYNSANQTTGPRSFDSKITAFPKIPTIDINNTGVGIAANMIIGNGDGAMMLLASELIKSNKGNDIFDGYNTPITELSETSRLLNQAVSEAGRLNIIPRLIDSIIDKAGNTITDDLKEVLIKTRNNILKNKNIINSSPQIIQHMVGGDEAYTYMPKEYKKLTIEESSVPITIDNSINAINSEVLSSLSKDLNDKDYSYLNYQMDKLKEYYPDIRIEYINPSKNNIDYEGKFDPYKQIIYIKNNDNKAITLQHELAHAITLPHLLDYYNNNLTNTKDLIEYIDKQYRYTLKNKPSQRLDKLLKESSERIDRLAISDGERKAFKTSEYISYVLSDNSIKKELDNSKFKGYNIPKLLQDVLNKLFKFIGLEKVFNNIYRTHSENIKFIYDTLVEVPGSKESIIKMETLPELYSATETYKNIKDKANEVLDKLVSNSNFPKVDRILRQKNIAAENASDILKYTNLGILTNSDEQKAFALMKFIGKNRNLLDSNIINQIHSIVDNFIDNINSSGLDKDIIKAIKNTSPEDITPTILALSTISDNIKDAVNKFNIDKKTKLPLNNIDNLLTESFDQFINMSNKLFRYKIGTKEDINTHLAGLLNETSFIERASRLDDIPINVYNEANSNISNILSKVSKKGISKLNSLQENKKSKLIQTSINMAKTTLSILDKDSSNTYADALTGILNKEGSSLLGREFWSEIRGTTNDTYDLNSSLKRSKAIIAAIRQDNRNIIPKVLDEFFNNKLSSDNWKDIHTVLHKTELLNTDIKHISDILDNPKKYSEKIEKVLSKEVINKANELVNYLKDKTLTTNNLLRNPYAIGYFTGNTNNENLITYYIQSKLLQNIDKETINKVNNIIKEYPEGIENLIDYNKSLVKWDSSRLDKSNRSKLNKWFGFTPIEYIKPQDNREVILGAIKDKEYYQNRGYEYIRPYTGSADRYVKDKLGYYRSVVGYKSKFIQGAIQIVQPSASGISLTNQRSIDRSNIGMIISDPETVNSINSLRVPSNNEGLIPIYNNKGNISAYEVIIDPLLVPNNERELQTNNLLGIQRGRQYEELLSSGLNKEIISSLKNTYNKASLDSRREDFINIAKSKDPIIKDVWDKIPSGLKEDIFKEFGKDIFPVRRDMLNNAIGFKEASVTDLITGETRLSQEIQTETSKFLNKLLGKNTYKYLKLGEQDIKDTVKAAKNIIVVRSLIVPTANLLTNILQNKMRGISDVFKQYTSKLEEIRKLEDNKVKIVQLQAKEAIEKQKTNPNKNLLKEYSDKIKYFRDQNQHMSIYPLYNLGEYSAIETSFADGEKNIQGGRYIEKLEELVDKIPNNILRQGVKYGIVSQDTALYKLMDEFNQYGDFIAKSVYFDHLIKKGLSESEAHKKVMDEFINYDNISGRTRTYLDSMGLTWFMNYKIRAMKILVSLIQENPLSLLVSSFGYMPTIPYIDIGDPYQDNLLYKTLNGTIPYSIGYGSLIRSPTLLPMVNILTP